MRISASDSPELPLPPAMESAAARFRLFDSVTTFLKNAADRRPLVLVLDDLHWADASSLLLLRFVALFFSADDGDGGERWKSDGTVAGTVPVTHLEFDDPVEELTAVDGTLFFTHSGEGQGLLGLWRSDGTVSGTTQIDAHYRIGTLTNVNGTLFFVAYDGGGIQNIWKSDGTARGTARVTDLPLFTLGGCRESVPTRCGLTAVNDRLFFVADDGSGVGLWHSDGTADGTQLVRHVSALPDSLVNIGATVYFLADDGNTGTELWRSDGTETGTVRVKDFHHGRAGSMPFDSADVDGTLFFVADDGNTGHEIWKTDGTEAGTVRVTDILHDTRGSNPADLTDVNGTLLFVADDGHAGAELWRSNGTPAGTRLVKDIKPAGGAFDPPDPLYAYLPSQPTK